MCSDTLELHGFNSCGYGAEDDAAGFAKRFPIYHVCPKCLAANFCGSAFLQNGLAFYQELDEVGKTQVDWQRGNVHCVLIQQLENLSDRS